METPLQTAARLLAALEDMARQESVLMRSLDFVATAELQARAGPLIEKLAMLAEEPGLSALRPRVAALIERREQSRHFLDAQLARLQAELRRIDETRARLAKVAPVYAAPAARPGTPRLNAAV